MKKQEQQKTNMTASKSALVVALKMAKKYLIIERMSDSEDGSYCLIWE